MHEPAVLAAAAADRSLMIPLIRSPGSSASRNRQSCGPSAMRIEFADSIMHSLETLEPMSIKAFKNAE